jgi:malonyl-CoA O-methyltransferase
MREIDKNKISLAFNQAAPEYEQHAFIQNKISEYLFERLDFNAIQPQNILDLGCGSGKLTRQLGYRYSNANIYGVDLALAMLKQAKFNAPKTWLWYDPKQNYLCADAERLPFADQSMDLVISNLMLQWCDNAAVFNEVARILRPDGVLLFSTLGPDTLIELRQSWAKVDDYSHVHTFLDMHIVGDMLYASGLKHPVLDAEWLNFKYSSVKDIMQGLKIIGASNISAQRRPGLSGKNKFKQMIQYYEQLRGDKGLPVTYEVIYGYALGVKGKFIPINPISY